MNKRVPPHSEWHLIAVMTAATVAGILLIRLGVSYWETGQWF